MQNKDYDMDCTISFLGKATIPSPILLANGKEAYVSSYINDNRRILYNIETSVETSSSDSANNIFLEKAGPRKNIYFEPAKVNAAIVTCGGLCPGLNNVIRSIVMCLWYRYGVKRICGIRFGYRGFLPEFELPTKELKPEDVDEIHRRGGTILGSSRGYGERYEEIVDSLEKQNINMLFVIGGDGTQKGALDISKEIKRRGLKIAIVGIPKTIDNDLGFIQKSFGFETAVSIAVDSIAAAHVESHDTMNGIGLVKLMGRETGYIVAHAALAINDVNFVLIPEVPFDIDGSNGLLAHLEKRLERRNHAVILVAEGAGQKLMADLGQNDASGNKKLADIGLFLKEKIIKHFTSQEKKIDLKYIDPSYMIRSAPANPNDSIYCARLGTNAVHAAMSGKTDLVVGLVHDSFVHIPIKLAVANRNCVDPSGCLWRDIVDATGQPRLMTNAE